MIPKIHLLEQVDAAGIMISFFRWQELEFKEFKHLMVTPARVGQGDVREPSTLSFGPNRFGWPEKVFVLSVGMVRFLLLPEI